MTLREWFNQVPQGRQTFYKDCAILDINPVSERYCLLTLQIPLPAGGEHRELVSMETEIEVKGE